MIPKRKGKKRFVTRNALASNLTKKQKQPRITDFFKGNSTTPNI